MLKGMRRTKTSLKQKDGSGFWGEKAEDSSGYR